MHGLDIDVEEGVVLEDAFLLGCRELVGRLRDDKSRVFLLDVVWISPSTDSCLPLFEFLQSLPVLPQH